MKIKMMEKPVFTLMLVFLLSSPGFGQMTKDTVQFTPDFKFRDGIFLNFDMVRENNPIPKAKLLTSVDYNDREFFTRLMESDKIYFYDNMGMRQEIDKSSIWGFSRNGVLYRKIQDNFNRITYFGSIIHYVADVTTYESSYSNYPYGGYYSPYNSYYNPYYSSYYNPYSYGSPYNSGSPRTNLHQYIIDFETGEEREYNLQNLEALLMRDPEIYEEFLSLRGKNQKKMMFVFLRKYNEKHPVFLPVNK
jgi:hypothetical protein